MANDIKNKRVNIYIDDQAAEAALINLQKQADKLNKTIAEGQAAGKNMVKEMSKLTDVNANIKKVQDQLDKGLKPSLQQQTQLVTQLRNELKRLSESDPQFAAKLKNFKEQTAELQRMKANVDAVNKASTSGGGFLKGMVANIAGLVAVNLTLQGTVKFLGDAIDEANQAEQAASRLRATLSNIGREDAFDRLKESASELANSLGTIDDDDVTEVFQQLITYGKLTENQIKQLTPVIVDFAAKQRIDLSEASSVIIKSLEGNGKALKEYGISVKDAGTVTDRFGVLMDELKPKVEGAAEAFGETTSGQIQKTTVQINQLKEDIGTKLLPVIKFLYQTFSDGLSGLGIIFNNTINFIKDLASETVYVTKVLGDFVTFQFKAGQQLQEKHAADKKAAAERLEWTNAQAEADKNAASIAADAVTKSKTEQNKILEQQIALQLGSLRAYQEIEKQGKANSEEGKKALQQLMADTKVVLKLKEEIAAKNDTRILGNGDPNDDGGKAAKAAEDAAKKLADLKKQAQDFLKQLDDENFLASVPNDLQQIALAAKKYFADIQQLTDLFNKNLINEDEFKKGLDEIERIYKDKVADLTKDPQAKIKIEIVPEVAQDELPKGDELYHKAGFLTPEEYDKQLKDEKEKRDRTRDEIISGVNAVMDVVGQLNQIQNEKDQRRLNKIQSDADKEKKSYERLLASKAISDKEYQKKVNEIDERTDQQREQIEKRAFARNKRLQIAQAIINGAVAIAKTFSELGWPAGIVGAAIVAATTAAQIAVISAQKFAAGGKVLPDGKITAKQNVPTQSNGDNVLAYVRRGEVILNERQQQALGGDRTFAAIGVPGFAPAYKSRPYMAVDTGGITANYTRLRYAGGGVAGVANGGTDTTRLESLMEQMIVQIQNQPVIIDNKISLNAIQKAEAQQTRITQNAIFK